MGFTNPLGVVSSHDEKRRSGLFKLSVLVTILIIVLGCDESGQWRLLGILFVDVFSEDVYVNAIANQQLVALLVIR